MGQPVPAGYELRRCTADDIDAVAELHSRRSHPFDGEDFRLIAEDPDAGAGWAAAVFDRSSGRPVSTLTLLDETVRVGAVLLPAGQVELVATDREHEGRGLARALMAWAHDESDRRGHVVQPMVGIPNFYRQFGYSYTIPMGLWRPIRSRPDEVDPSIIVRGARPDDVDALIALHVAEQAAADVSMGHSPACWRWIVARSGSVALVAERNGRVVAGVRTLPPEEARVASEFVATDGAAASTVLDALATRCSDMVILARQSTLAGRTIEPFLADVAEPDRELEWYYVRIPDVVPLLNRLRPELQRRLDEAGALNLPERLVISSYRSHVGADLAGGVLGDFERGGAMQAPIGLGGSGVPPDMWPPLLFGPFGAVELERRVPDVLLGRQREVMKVLFPPLSADLATFYVPW